MARGIINVMANTRNKEDTKLCLKISGRILGTIIYKLTTITYNLSETVWSKFWAKFKRVNLKFKCQMHFI